MIFHGIGYGIFYNILQTSLVLVSAVQHFVLKVLYRYERKVVPTVKNHLLLKSASKLADDIRKGKYKSEDAIQAYIDRILEVEPYINATVECCFEDALKKSRDVDALIASRKFTEQQLSVGKPLLGVPVSIKSLFHVKDMSCTAGFHLYSDLKGTEDAPAVAALKKAGAIVIATTNVPELGLDMETYNKIYGRSSNPYDTNRTCGGSSGGEAALIGAGASVLGLGTDLLGSLRIPAHFSGIFSHKPSRGLVSNHGTLPIERPDIPAEFCNAEIYKYITSGPMCRYAEDLMNSMKVLSLDNEMRKKFNHPVDFRKVKIYYLREIRNPLCVPVDRCIADALRNAASYFEKQYNVAPKEIKMPYLSDIDRCLVTVMEPLFKDLKASTIGQKSLTFEFVKYLIGTSKLCLSTFVMLGLILLPLLYRAKQSVYYQKMVENYKNEFNKLLDENTVLLMPTLPVTAPHHSETFPLLFSACYTCLFNVLGLPVTQCPLGLSKQGLPIGIQIVGCRNNDPLTIACAVELEKAFGGWKSH